MAAASASPATPASRAVTSVSCVKPSSSDRNLPPSRPRAVAATCALVALPDLNKANTISALTSASARRPGTAASGGRNSFPSITSNRSRRAQPSSAARRPSSRQAAADVVGSSAHIARHSAPGSHVSATGGRLRTEVASLLGSQRDASAPPLAAGVRLPAKLRWRSPLPVWCSPTG